VGIIPAVANLEPLAVVADAGELRALALAAPAQVRKADLVRLRWKRHWQLPATAGIYMRAQTQTYMCA